MVCPKSAITEKRRQIGTISKGEIKGIDIVYGELNVGEAMVKEVVALNSPTLTVSALSTFSSTAGPVPVWSPVSASLNVCVIVMIKHIEPWVL